MEGELCLLSGCGTLDVVLQSGRAGLLPKHKLLGECLSLSWTMLCINFDSPCTVVMSDGHLKFVLSF